MRSMIWGSLFILLVFGVYNLSAEALTWEFKKASELNDWTAIRGDWKIDEANGVLVGESLVDEGTLAVSNNIWKDEWVDYTIEIKVRSIAPKNRHFGLGFRDDGKGNHYGFYLDDDPACCEKTYWFGFYNGSYNAISAFWGENGNYNEAEDWNVMKIIVKGFSFELYINDKNIANYKDNNMTFDKGPVVLVNDSNGGQKGIVEFDYIKIDGAGIPSADVLVLGKLTTTWATVKKMN